LCDGRGVRVRLVLFGLESRQFVALDVFLGLVPCPGAQRGGEAGQDEGDGGECEAYLPCCDGVGEDEGVGYRDFQACATGLRSKYGADHDSGDECEADGCE